MNSKAEASMHRLYCTNKQPQKTLFCFLFLIPFSSCSPSLTTSLCANVCVQRRTAAGHTRWSINDNLTRLRRPLRSSSENCLLPPSGEVGHLRWWLLTRNESWTVWIGPKIVCASTDIAFSRRKWKKKKKRKVSQSLEKHRHVLGQRLHFIKRLFWIIIYV